MSKTKAIVLVHGIWMKGFEFIYLGHQLKKQGFKIYHFTYSSLFKTPQQNAEHLYQFVARIKEQQVHWIAHSLGGIIVSHLFANYTLPHSGKVIMLGTPLNGSAVAHYFVQRWWLKWLLGKSIVNGLLGDVPGWDRKRDLCMIAGSKNIGLGVFLAPKAMQELNDGTVNLSETISKQCSEHYLVPHSHFSMLWSKEVLSIIKRYLSG